MSQPPATSQSPPVPFAPLQLQVRRVTREVVGRSTELAAIGQELRSAAAGRLVAVTVEGEPGIGKTRLIVDGAEQADRARVHGPVGRRRRGAPRGVPARAVDPRGRGGRRPRRPRADGGAARARRRGRPGPGQPAARREAPAHVRPGRRGAARPRRRAAARGPRRRPPVGRRRQPPAPALRRPRRHGEPDRAHGDDPPRGARVRHRGGHAPRRHGAVRRGPPAPPVEVHPPGERHLPGRDPRRRSSTRAWRAPCTRSPRASRSSSPSSPRPTARPAWRSGSATPGRSRRAPRSSSPPRSGR